MEGLLPAVLAFVIAVPIGAGIGVMIYRGIVQSRIKQLEADARLQLEAVRSEQKDLVLRATDEALRLRNETEAQVRDARTALAKQEERLLRKEENLDRKLEGVERRERQVQNRERQVEQLTSEAEQLRQRQRTVAHHHLRVRRPGPAGVVDDRSGHRNRRVRHGEPGGVDHHHPQRPVLQRRRQRGGS